MKTSLQDKITDDVKVAMKARDSERLGTLRLIQAAFKNKQIELRSSSQSSEQSGLPHEVVLQTLKKMKKERLDSISQYEKAQRADLVEKEKSELSIIEGYLPQSLTKEETEALVKKIIEKVGASSIKDMGRVMKELEQASGGAADNRLASQIIKEALS